MKRLVLHLVYLGMADEPEWCEHCALPSLLRIFYVLQHQGTVPSLLRSFTHCTDCGTQGQ